MATKRSAQPERARAAPGAPWDAARLRARGRALDEQRAVELLAATLGQGRAPDGVGARSTVVVGIGDDAAVLRPPRGERLVWTIDSAEEGVHFRREWLPLGALGRRSFHAATSDLAAMGARPLGALCHLTLPGGFSEAELRALARGQRRAADELGCPLIGGNLTRGDALRLTTTVLGAAARPVLRQGARPGDELWLVGELGLARAGLLLLLSGDMAAGRARAARACLAAWRQPRALLAEGRALASRARAALDVSDGLGEDLARLARASGVRILVEERALSQTLHPALTRVAERLGVTPLELALRGGEDYALLACGSARRRPAEARVLGRVVAGEGTALVTADGSLTPLPRGWDHLADE